MSQMSLAQDSPLLTVSKPDVPETVLTVQNLVKQFGRIKAVNNLSLEIKRGQVFGMLGPNGSGKTTTLGMLMGVVNPTAGEFRWFNEAPTPGIRRKIGAVLEHPIFYPYLSGLKNLELNAMIKKCPAENIPRVLEIVELTERQNDKYKTYSLGMKQRLAIASALLNDPTVLILDEPTNGLDPMGIAEIRNLIRKIAANGKTIILASHLLDEVQKVCTHFCVLKRGVLVHAGPVDDVGRCGTSSNCSDGLSRNKFHQPRRPRLPHHVAGRVYQPGRQQIFIRSWYRPKSPGDTEEEP
jgi:ABC-2 type transport system ATP-binding protein